MCDFILIGKLSLVLTPITARGIGLFVNIVAHYFVDV